MTREQSDLSTEGGGFGRMARVYDLLCSIAGLGTGFKRRILELGDLQREHRVLDVGCGTGVLTRLARQRASEVAGIDAAPEMISVARSKAERDGLDIDFRTALIEELPYPDEHFDVAFASLVVHHLPAAVRLRGLREVLRVLKPGGRFVVADDEQVTPLLEEAGFAEVRPRGKAWLLGLISLTEGRKA